MADFFVFSTVHLLTIIISATLNCSTISEGMFDGCESLSTIYISKAVKVIEKNAFRNCKNLKEIIYEGNINDIEIKEGNEILK